MKILIKNGHVIDPQNNIDKKLDILVEEGKIKKVDENILEENINVIDAKDCFVTPGFIDLHVHLREPGYEYKETINTGSKSAVMGGFTTICCMPNTAPVIDNDIMVHYIKMKSEKEALCNILPIGAITKGQEGETLSDIGKMHKAGICAISEDGKSVLDSAMMKTAFKYAKMFNLPIFAHCEDTSLVGKGVMNNSTKATLLGLKGISNDSEEVIVARDIILANAVKAQLHICHISTEGSIHLLRDAKKREINVTAEVTPHHFTLIDEDIKDYDANFKMNPPLRSKKDKEAILKALKDDTIDVIATDHAPHSTDEKNCEFERALNGIIGLETAFSIGFTELVKTNILTPFKFIEKLTKNPAKILNNPNIGHLSVGANADIVISNPSIAYKINKEEFKSKARNTPFDGREVTGKILYTIVGGKIIVENGKLREEFDNDN